MRKFLCAIFISVFCCTAHALPTGYTQLEYIQSTGSQYINTGIYPTETTAIETKFINNNQTSLTSLLVGDGYSSAKYMLSIVASTNAVNRINGLTLTLTNFWTVGTLFNVYMNSSGVRINGVTRPWSSGTLQAFTGTKTLKVFGDGVSSSERFSRVKMYYLKIWDNGALVRNFVPAKNANDVIGMYDTVSDTFFTNAGSGTFVAGPEIGIASTSYVAGMHEAINTTKQNKLTSTGANPNVIVTGDANGIVSSFTANNGIVTVTRSAVTLPWGSENSANRAEVWVD